MSAAPALPGPAFLRPVPPLIRCSGMGADPVPQGDYAAWLERTARADLAASLFRRYLVETIGYPAPFLELSVFPVAKPEPEPEKAGAVWRVGVHERPRSSRFDLPSDSVVIWNGWYSPSFDLLYVEFGVETWGAGSGSADAWVEGPVVSLDDAISTVSLYLERYAEERRRCAERAEARSRGARKGWQTRRKRGTALAADTPRELLDRAAASGVDMNDAQAASAFLTPNTTAVEVSVRRWGPGETGESAPPFAAQFGATGAAEGLAAFNRLKAAAETAFSDELGAPRSDEGPSPYGYRLDYAERRAGADGSETEGRSISWGVTSDDAAKVEAVFNIAKSNLAERARVEADGGGL